METIIKFCSCVMALLLLVFVMSCLVVGTLGLWHLVFGWPK